MRKLAVWDRKNRRFELYLEGEFIGYCHTTYTDACALLNQAAYERLCMQNQGAQNGR